MTAPRDAVDENPFQPLGREREHYWRVLRMAKATGTDLVQAMAEGDLTHRDWARVVTRCRGCGWVDGCAHWLDAGSDEPRPCPDGCRNQKTFEDLK